MSVDPWHLLAILGMAVATYATRLAGLYLMRGVTVRGRLKAAFDALPPAILTAVIAPTVLATGWRETVAALITIGAAMLRLPLVVVIVVGVGGIVVLRHLSG